MPTFSDEDVDSDVGNWDSSDEEEAPKKETVAAQPKKEKGKKGLAAKIAAREAREKKEREMKNMTPQERHALEMKQQEEDAMAMASDLVANVTVEDPDSIDIGKFVPKTKHDFKIFAEAVNKKIASLSESSFYPEFVCDISREAIKPMKLDDVRKVETVLKVHINDMVKATQKKGKKGKKPGLNTGGGKGQAPDRNRYDDDDFGELEDMI